MSGLNRWFSPSARYWYWPPGGSCVWTIGPPGRPGAVLAGLDLLAHDLDADAADPGRRPGEVLVDEVAVEPDGLEDLGAVVAVDRGDAHPADRLDDALGRGLAVALLRGLRGTRDDAQADLVVDGLEGEVRVDGGGAVPDQQAEVVGLARLAGLQEQAHPPARAGAHEVVVDRADRQEGRDGRVGLGVAAVREDDLVVALGDGLGRLAPEVLDRPPQAGAVVGHLEQDRQRDRAEAVAVGPAVERPDRLQLRVGDHGRGERDLVGGVRPGLEQVGLRPDGPVGGHDDLLADRVHRRVGDLREELLEVVVEELRAFREDGQRGVVAHGADRVGAGGRHGVDDQPDVLGGVAEDLLAAEDRLVVGQDDRARVGQVGQVDQGLADPLLVGVLAGDRRLELVVGDDPALLRVHEEHAAGLEAPLGDDVLGRDVQHARLAGHDDAPVAGHGVAAGAEAVAVQRRADAHPVRERQRRRAVPRLHEARVVLVERAALRGHRGVPAPRLGDHHHHRVGQAAARQVEQLEHVVEDRRVRAVHVHGRQDLVEVLAEHRRPERGLAREHPVHVAAQRVDLAVVADVPVRVRPGPRREGVGREAGVDQAQRALEALVEQVRVEGQQLGGVEHPLVDDGPAGHRRDVDVAAAGEGAAADGLLDEAAGDVEAALEGQVLVVAEGEAVRAGDERLDDDRLAGACAGAEARGIRGDVAPAQELEPLAAQLALEALHGAGAARLVARQEDHRDAVARLGEA